LAFGHELATTPLQVAMAFAAVANGGVLMRPRLVRAWVDEDGRPVREEPPREVRRVLSESTAATLREMLRAVIEYGTAREIRHPSIAIAGKTGTAEKIDDSTGKYVKGKFNSSFVGMAPADAPAMVCLVLLDEPSQLKYGGQSAAPIFREILDRLSLEWNWPSAGKMVLASRDSAAVRMDGDVRRTEAAQPATPAESGRTRAGAMPDLQNSTLRDALLRLRELGVEVEYTGEGRVIGQQPDPGTPLRRGMRCRLNLGWMG
jgi:membrane peptidoglycan carboxypeptidase